MQSSLESVYPRVKADIDITRYTPNRVSSPIDVHVWNRMEEIAQGPPCWMWDYLRRSGARGFFLAISGGVDSAVCAGMVYCMARIVFKAISRGSLQPLHDLRKILRDEDYTPKNPKDIVSKLLVGAYLKSKNSSLESRERAKKVIDTVGGTIFDL